MLFGFTATLAAFMVLYCPETKGRPVPQNAADLDVLKANTTFCFCSTPATADVDVPADGKNGKDLGVAEEPV